MLDYETLRVIWWLLLGVVLDRLRGHGRLRLGALALRCACWRTTTTSAAR